MSFFFNQPDPKRRRFPIPNGVWKWELKPQGFAILAYLCYLHVHCNKNALPSADEIASQLHMSKDMAVKQIAELNRRGLLDQHKLYLTGQGVTHDQTQAMVWFSRSAAQGNQYAQFFLERQNDLRPPSVMLAATRLLYHMSRIFEDHSLPQSSAGLHVDRKLRRKIQEKKIALGHKPDDHAEEQNQGGMVMGGM